MEIMISDKKDTKFEVQVSLFSSVLPKIWLGTMGVFLLPITLIGLNVPLSPSTLLFLALIGLFVATGVTTLGYFTHIQHLTKIAEQTQEFGGGNLKAHVNVSRPDEIGCLATQFNAMTLRLRKKIFELSALSKITGIINQSQTYQKALDESLAYIVTLFLAKRGSIMLLGDNSQRLHLRSVRTFGEIETEVIDSCKELHEYVPLSIGEGIAGKVVETSQPILCKDCRTDERFLPYPHDAEIVWPKSLLCVPLTIQGKSLGVINLSDRSDNRTFENDDLETLSAIASQMALSIDNARLHELAITDGLTQLFIHRYFQIKLDEETRRARRYNDPMSLVLIDIDHFKHFNDLYGHQMGDRVLRETARLMKVAARSVDVPCRYGGEEFAIILPHTTADQALIFAERYRKRVEEFEFQGADRILHASISLGIAEFPAMTTEKTELIRLADTALYTSKNRGRNSCTVYQKGIETLINLG